MPFFGHLEHNRERLVAHRERKRIEIGKFAERVRKHACLLFSVSSPLKDESEVDSPVWNELRVVSSLSLSGAVMTSVLTKPAYVGFETIRVRISALRCACQLSISTASCIVSSISLLKTRYRAEPN